jgi:glycosyltransferase involved in cell wall biosynthesis
MKILIVCPFAHPNIGGVETHLTKLTNYLIQQGHFVYLLTYQPLTTKIRGPAVEKRPGLEIRRISWFGYNFFPKLEPYFPLVLLYLFPGLFVGSLWFYLKHRKEIDVIHAHGFAAALVVKIISKIFPKRAVVSTHAVYSLEKRGLLAALVKFLLGSFDAVLAVGETSRRELIAVGLDEKKVRVHPNWITLETFKTVGREKAKKDLGLSGLVVLFVGRFLEKKGVKILLDASKKLDNVKFVFVGGGELENEVRAAEEKQKNVQYVGKLFQDKPEELQKLIEYYGAADFLVSPVLYDEGFSAVLLEACASGTPIMISRRGCPPYFLDETVAVFLSREPTADEVVEKLNFYLSHPDELQELQSACRPFAEKTFSEQNAEVILGSYR